MPPAASTSLPLPAYMEAFRARVPDAPRDAIVLATETQREGRSVDCAVRRWRRFVDEVAEADQEAIRDAQGQACLTAVGLTVGELRAAMSGHTVREGLIRRVIRCWYNGESYFVSDWQMPGRGPERFMLRRLVPEAAWSGGPVESWDQRLARIRKAPRHDLTGVVVAGPDGRRWVIAGETMPVAVADRPRPCGVEVESNR